MAEFQLRDEEPLGAPTIDDIVDGVAEELGLTRDAHLEVKLSLRQNLIRSVQALQDAIVSKKLCGVVHPYVADALCNRLKNRSSATFEFDVFPEASLETRNPTHFKHVAIFVHRVAPIPGSTKGKIACTWAFDMDPEDCSVTELKTKLEGLALCTSERMRLVFNGFTLTSPNLLSEYDIQGGDSLYLYTIKDPEETMAISHSCDEGYHVPLPVCCCPPVAAVCSPGAPPCGHHHAHPTPATCGPSATWGVPPCCCQRGTCTFSQGIMMRPYACHAQRCQCGSCVATSISPLKRRCPAAAEMRR